MWAALRPFRVFQIANRTARPGKIDMMSDLSVRPHIDPYRAAAIGKTTKAALPSKRMIATAIMSEQGVGANASGARTSALENGKRWRVESL